jgi:hypothetical protein
MTKAIIKRKNEPEVQQVFASEEEKAKSIIEAYKKQNPVKYEQKKVALDNWLKSMKQT